MSSGSTEATTVPEDHGPAWDAIAREFERAWDRGERPKVEDYLDRADQRERPALVLALTGIDLERRLRAGLPARVEDYAPFLERYPPLHKDEALLGLIIAEYKQRRRREDTLGPEEYGKRFPDLSETLRSLLDSQLPYLPTFVGPDAADAGPPLAQAPQPLPRSCASRCPACGGQPLRLALDAAGVQAWCAACGRRLERLGKYLLLREVGHGGFGTVWEAYDLALQRTVALKMIRPEVHASPGDLRRLRTEAEAIARVQHPNIVQIYEVGDHEGQPYLSLEFCAGGSLEKKLAGTPLQPQPGAALVETLARAMQVAHQRGVLHRDLKPANVLLAEGDTPKITDFGLARKLDEAGATVTGVIMGTPSYMAPEQAQGRKDLGPACDVYALGAILYQCLTGRPPFRAATTLDTVMQVLHEEPVAPTRLNGKVPRDLETICLKCLHKDAGRRYPSAEALAEDLRRYKTGEPIAARPVAWPERLAKWMRRYPAVAALSGALLLAVALGFLLVTLEWLAEGTARARAEAKEREAEAARDRELQAKNLEHLARLEADQRKREAEAARDSARQAKDLEHQARMEAEQRKHEALAQRDLVLKYFTKAEDAVQQMLTEVSEGDQLLRNEPHFELVRKRLLEKALNYYQEFLKEKSDDPAVKLATAAAYRRVGSIYSELGNKAEAEQAFRTSLEMLRELHAADSNNAAYQKALASSCLRLGGLLRGAKKWAEAEDLLRQALGLYRQLLAREPDLVAYRDGVAESCNAVGLILVDRGRLPEAEKLLREALALRRQLVKDYPRVAYYRQDLATSCNNLALLLRDTGRAKEAEPLHWEDYELCTKLVRDYPGIAGYREDLAITCDNLANFLIETGRPEDAERMYRQAITLRQQLVADFPTIPEYRRSLATSCNRLALLLGEAGRAAEAETLYRKDVALCLKLVKDHPNVPRYRSDLAFSCNVLANLLSDGRVSEEAEQFYRMALSLYKELADEGADGAVYRSGLATTYNNLGLYLAGVRRYVDAEASYRQAFQLRQLLAAEQPGKAALQLDLATTLRDLGDLYRSLRSLYKARPVYEHAVRCYETALALAPGLPKVETRLADCCQRLAEVSLMLGDHATAAAAAGRLVTLPGAGGWHCYWAAWYLARSSALVAHDGELSAAEKERASGYYAYQALRALRHGVERGLHTELVREDSVFESLRGRIEFRLLVRELGPSR
jgi:tetratricopeptide (TPR) repeat protein